MGTRFDVNIAGYALTVQTERSAEHMARLVDTLNGRVREIQKAGGTSNYLNIVMLAAMELADDVLTSEERIREARRKSRELEEQAGRFEADSLRLQEELRGLSDEMGGLRQEVEALRREREGLKESVDRKSRDLLATLEDALK
jgi:cell division protein ZapA (FtsZ GTPase activity inhibitor)